MRQQEGVFSTVRRAAQSLFTSKLEGKKNRSCGLEPSEEKRQTPTYNLFQNNRYSYQDTNPGFPNHKEDL
jgi:hypothetical protein